MGFKYGEEDLGKWNLELKGSDPALTLLGRHDELVAVDLPRFDLGDLNVPISEVSGTRGGTENSLTKIFVKPTHMIGGYAPLSYGFNYYGPTGSQRDELTVMRKRESEVVY